MTRDIERRLSGTLTAMADQITEESLTTTSEDLHARPAIVRVNAAHHSRHPRWLAPVLAAASVAALIAGALAIKDVRHHTPQPANTVHVTPTPTPSSTRTPTPTSAADPSLLPLGKEEPASKIPWNKVGEGWTVAVWTPGKVVAEPNDPKLPLTVYVVNPIGGRYRVTTLAPSGTIGGLSPDGRRLMVSVPEAYPGQTTTFTEIDLATGKKSQIAVTGARTTPVFFGYTRPRGTAMILGEAITQSTAYTYARYSLSGDKQLDYTSDMTVGPYAADGLTFASSHVDPVEHVAKIAVVSNGGKVLKDFPMPRGFGYCDPVSWWTTNQIQAVCSLNSGGSDIFLFNVSTGAVTRLTWAVAKHDGDGYRSAFRAGQKTLVAGMGACGDRVAELNAQGTGDELYLPMPRGVSTSYSLISTTDSSLMLRTGTGWCDSGAKIQPSLVRFDLASGSGTSLLGPGRNGGAVLWAQSFGQP